MDDEDDDYDERGRLKKPINLRTAILKLREKKFEYETLDQQFTEYIAQIKFKKALKRKHELI